LCEMCRENGGIEEGPGEGKRFVRLACTVLQ
jgi:hypothetical protein